MSIIGWIMIAAVFVGLFLFMARDSSIRVALCVFGTTAIVFSWVAMAVYLIQGGAR